MSAMKRKIIVVFHNSYFDTITYYTYISNTSYILYILRVPFLFGVTVMYHTLPYHTLLYHLYPLCFTKQLCILGAIEPCTSKMCNLYCNESTVPTDQNINRSSAMATSKTIGARGTPDADLHIPWAFTCN